MTKQVQLHVYIDEETHRKLWDITKARYTAPAKKLSSIIREALDEYIERHPVP